MGSFAGFARDALAFGVFMFVRVSTYRKATS
jgi:hypothetical protein